MKASRNDFSNAEISLCFPSDYKDEELLKSIPDFAFPFSSNFESPAVDHFTFVLTDIDSKFRFGFCRLSAGSQSCLCIVSYYPWFEIFYRLLNYVAEIQGCEIDSDFTSLLLSLIHLDASVAPGTKLQVANQKKTKIFAFNVPNSNSLPSIPDNRNLTEYYSTVDSYNMMMMFASMLFERRIVVVSRKLSRLTACVHGASSLFHPFHWQHLYIPILPPHLVDYCCAPMPFLIGIHSSLMSKITKADLGDAVILDADSNSVSSPYDDLGSIPTKVVSFLKKELRAHKKNKATTPCVLMGQTVSRAFLRTMVRLIGGYHSAVTDHGSALGFDKAVFLESRSATVLPFLEHLLHVQAFEQFITDRLQILKENPEFVDEFESEIHSYTAEKQTKGKYKVMWSTKYDKTLTDIANKVKSTGMSTFKTVKTTINDFCDMDFGGGPRRQTEVDVKIIVSDASSKATTTAVDSTFVEVPRLSPPALMRNSKPRSGHFEANRHRSFRLSNDDSEVLDILLQASLPLLSDVDMDKVFRKYSYDNLDCNVSASDDSDISRDTTSSGREEFTLLRHENLTPKSFGNCDRLSSEVKHRMVSSAPNMIERVRVISTDPEVLSKTTNAVDVIVGKKSSAFQVTFDSTALPTNGENGSDTMVRRFDQMMMMGKLTEKSSDFNERRAKRLSVRYLPNVQQIIQRYEKTSTEPTSAKPLPVSPPSTAFIEPMVAAQTARYNHLEQNPRPGVYREPRTNAGQNSRTLDNRCVVINRTAERKDLFPLKSCSSNDSSSSAHSNL